MIHFLCPELRSQHLGEEEALTTGPFLLSQPTQAPELPCSDMSCREHRTGVACRPDTLRASLEATSYNSEVVLG